MLTQPQDAMPARNHDMLSHNPLFIVRHPFTLKRLQCLLVQPLEAHK